MSLIRDPIHGMIECDGTEIALINSTLVQRLKWVMQLSAVYHVYNGGTHTRFAHSLGVMHIAGEYIRNLIKSSPEFANVFQKYTADHYIKVARIAGLLHDIGHGPFSHAFDSVIYQKIYGNGSGHDHARLALIKCELLKPFIEACGVSTDELEQVWAGKIRPTSTGTSDIEMQVYDIIGAIVQGPLGSDRIDFTLRDSYYTGTTHLGTIAHKRIIKNASVSVKNDRLTLCYKSKCIRDIILALDGRLYLYHDVYLHKTSMAASLLIEEMLRASSQTLNLVEKTKDPNQFRRLNDNAIIGQLSMGDPNDPGTKACNNLLDRKLPKLLHEQMVHAMDNYDPNVWIADWCPSGLTNDLRLVRTRIISGIDPVHFEKYRIKFASERGLISCAEVLDSIKYKRSQEPYYIVRLFQMPN